MDIQEGFKFIFVCKVLSEGEDTRTFVKHIVFLNSDTKEKTIFSGDECVEILQTLFDYINQRVNVDNLGDTLPDSYTIEVNDKKVVLNQTEYYAFVEEVTRLCSNYT